MPPEDTNNNEACELALSYVDEWSATETVKAAIAKAKGEAIGKNSHLITE